MLAAPRALCPEAVQDGLDQPFNVDPWFVGQVADNLADWFLFPRYTHRPSLSAWELDAPPAEITD